MQLRKQFNVSLAMPRQIEDGNEFFDSVETSRTLPYVVRKYGPFIWYKAYSTDGSFDQPKWTFDTNKEEDFVLLLVFQQLEITFHFENRTISFRYRENHEMTELEICSKLLHLLGLENNFTLDIQVDNVKMDATLDYIITPDILFETIKEQKIDMVLKEEDSDPSENFTLFFNKCQLHFSFSQSTTKTYIEIDNISTRFEMAEVEENLAFLIDQYKQRGKRDDNEKGEKATLSHLRASVPELFVMGYSRECMKKPFIVSQEEAESLHLQGRKTMVYPETGEYSRIYACPPGYYPGLKKNKLSNKDLFDYIPVCYTTEHLLRKNSNYSKYKQHALGILSLDEEGPRSKNKIYTRINGPLEPGLLGRAPWLIDKLLSQKTHVLRMGIHQGPFSCLFCLDESLRQNGVPAEAERKARALTMSLFNDDFLDLSIHLKALEDYFDVEVYIFEMDRNSKVALRLHDQASGKMPVRRKNSSVSLLLHKHISHYELLINTDPEKLARYKSILMTLLEEKREKQNEVVLEGDPQPVLDMMKHREKAYFFHDLFAILASFVEREVLFSGKYVVIKAEMPDFSPMLMKYRFSSALETITYYSKHYPELFEKTRMIVSPIVIERLKGCTFKKPLFPMVVKEAHFTKRKHNVIVV